MRNETSSSIRRNGSTHVDILLLDNTGIGLIGWPHIFGLGVGKRVKLPHGPAAVTGTKPATATVVSALTLQMGRRGE